MTETVNTQELTIKCESFGCDRIVAEDIFDGWVNVKVDVAYYHSDSGSFYCEGHGDPSTDEMIIMGEVQVS